VNDFEFIREFCNRSKEVQIACVMFVNVHEQRSESTELKKESISKVPKMNGKFARGTRWSDDEDFALLAAVDEFGVGMKTWRKVARQIGRTHWGCRDRWNQLQERKRQ
jgi:hypothetical protein